MHLVFERDLAVPPAAAWPLLTDPGLMNRWSTARVTSLAPGDGGGPGGVGALRAIALGSGARGLTFEEVIEEAEAPHRLAYRVVAGLPIRRHRGLVTLDARGGGAHLRWSVELDFPAPGMELLARRLLAPQLDASLDALARVAVETPAASLPAPPPQRRIDESGELPALYAAAEACAARQRALADELAADPKRWFPRVYQFVTELQIEGCRRGDFTHPGWVLRLVPAFHAYFESNLARARQAAPGLEAHWRSSFRAMDQAARWFRRDELRAIFYGVAKGMQAHIEEDLPRALAETYARHYAGRCDYARFRADYLRMSGVFRAAGQRLGAEVPDRLLPLRARLLRAVLPAEAGDWLLNRSFYDLPRERRKAFERGERIAALLTAAPGRA